MFDFDVFEVGIGLALLFAFMSLIATALCEVIENFAKVRSKELLSGIAELLGDKTDSALIRDFYEHPLIAALYRGTFDPKVTKNLPSYIPRQSFSLAALRLVAGPNAPLSIQSLRDALANTERPNRMQEAVKAALDVADDDLAKLRQTLEEWFDGSMDRVAGWYKRRTGYMLLAMGVVASALFNVDAILIAERLSNDSRLRDAVVANAGRILDSNIKPASAATAPEAVTAKKTAEAEDHSSVETPVGTLVEQFSVIGYPIGWTWDGGPKPLACSQPGSGRYFRCGSVFFGILFSLPGWLISTLAVTLGAPFWFDLLNKLMVIRSTVKPREKSPDEYDSQVARQAATRPSPDRSHPIASEPNTGRSQELAEHG